jgi:hypothetical protein
MHLTTRKQAHPLLDSRRRRRDPPAADLAGLQVQAVKGDLAQMHIKPRDDRLGQPLRHHAHGALGDR